MESARCSIRTWLLLDLGILGFVFAFMLPFVGDRIDGTISSLFFKIRGPLSAPQEIVVIGIDDDSFQYLDKPWPWPRRLHAELLETLSAARARVVAFDIVFDTKSNDPEDDRLFAEAIANHPGVILATTRSVTDSETYTKESLSDPTPRLLSPETAVGSIELPVDADGAVRRALPAIGGRPSFSYLAAGRFAGLSFGEPFTINFAGPAGTIRTVSYYQALKADEFLHESTLRDKLIFIGSTANLSSDPNHADRFLTPFSRALQRMPGVEIHANIASNLLKGNTIVPVPVLWARGLGALIALACALAFFRLTLSWQCAAFAAVVCVVLLLAYWAFAAANYQFPLAGFVVPMGAVFALNMLGRYYETYKSAEINRFLLQRSEERISEILAVRPPERGESEESPATGTGETWKVFVSYRRQAEDARYMAEILEFLGGLRKEGIEFWTDQELRLGDRWNEEIRERIAQSDIALVLVSQAYLDSDYCINVEIGSFLQRDITIMPIMLFPCEWKRHDWLRERQFLPGHGETLAEHYQDAGKRQRMFLAIRSALRKEAGRLRGVATE